MDEYADTSFTHFVQRIHKKYELFLWSNVSLELKLRFYKNNKFQYGLVLDMFSRMH